MEETLVANDKIEKAVAKPRQPADLPHSRDEIVLELKSTIINATNLKHLTVDTIDASAPLFQDGLGMDSIDLLELIVHLDRRFGLKLRNDDSGREALRTVNTLADSVLDHMKRTTSERS